MYQITGEIITNIPTEVPVFNNKLPNDLGNQETEPDDLNNNPDVDVDDNNDITNNCDDNKEDGNNKIRLTILLIFILYKPFCFIKKLVK